MTQIQHGGWSFLLLHHVHFVVENFHLYGIVNWCIVYICIILGVMWHTFMFPPSV